MAYLVAVVPPRARNVPPVGLTMSTLGFGLLLGWGTRAFFGGSPFTLQPWMQKVPAVVLWDGKTWRAVQAARL